jgi:DNA-directed RNA polymerase specialized sigma24 family protein
MCRRWARAKLRIWNGGDGKGHEDGWPASSIAGRIRDEGEGLGQGAIRQHYAEVMVGEALIVARALDGMAFGQRLALHLHYLTGASAREKARFVGVSKAGYWTLLGVAHNRVAAFVEGMEYADGVARIPQKVGAR